MGKKKNKVKKIESKKPNTGDVNSKRKAFFKAVKSEMKNRGISTIDLETITDGIKRNRYNSFLGLNVFNGKEINGYSYGDIGDEQEEMAYAVDYFIKRLKVPYTTHNMEMISYRDAVVVAITSALIRIGYSFDLKDGSILLKVNNEVVGSIVPYFMVSHISICLNSIIFNHTSVAKEENIATFDVTYVELYDVLPGIIGELTSLITPSKPAVQVLYVDKSLTPEEAEELLEELELEDAELKLPDDFEEVDRRKSAQEVLDEHEEKLINTRVEVVEILSDLDAEEPIRKESNNGEELE